MLGDKIKSLREAKKLDQKDIAEKAGITPAYLSQIEKNIRKNPSTRVLNKIADALGVSVDEFFKDEPINPSDKEKEQELIAKYENMPDFQDAEEAMKFILEQPALAAYGGYDLKSMTAEEIIELANDLLFALRISIERRKKK